MLQLSQLPSKSLLTWQVFSIQASVCILYQKHNCDVDIVPAHISAQISRITVRVLKRTHAVIAKGLFKIRVHVRHSNDCFTFHADL